MNGSTSCDENTIMVPGRDTAVSVGIAHNHYGDHMCRKLKSPHVVQYLFVFLFFFLLNDND